MNSKTRVRMRPAVRPATRAAASELRLGRLEEVRKRLLDGFYDDPAIDEDVGRILAQLLGE